MKLLKFLEKFLPLVFWLFLIFAFDTPYLATLTVIAAVIHEAGHLTFGISRGFLRLFPSPHPTGFRISSQKNASYKDELMLLIGGPVLNFSVFLVSRFLFVLFEKAFLYDFAFINLLTALANLLPIKSYDGYRIIETLLLMRGKDGFTKISALSWLSFTFTALLTFLSLYLLLKFGEGYWIFALFFSSVLLDLKKLTEKSVL